MNYVKSKQRIADHGEVFTPHWLVQDMLNLVQAETERIESRFLEPACGSGNFLVPVLERKLTSVQLRYGKSGFEATHHGLYALMCVYGIELLNDNIEECRQNLLEVFLSHLGLASDGAPAQAANNVLRANIVHGDAMTMKTENSAPIVFPEWSYLGKGKYQRRDFLYDHLTQRSSFQNTLFEDLEAHKIFVPLETYPKMSIDDLSKLGDE